MKVVLLTTLPNRVASALSSLLGDGLFILDILKTTTKREAVMRLLREHSPDTLITYRCPYLLPADVFSRLPLGAYNLHPSLLPKYKGLNPWEEIFRNHETEGGVTLHRISREADSGAIVSQQAFAITPSDTLASARTKADEVAARLACDFVSNLQANASLWALPNKFDYLEAVTSRQNLLFLHPDDRVSYHGVYKEGAFCMVFQLAINGEQYAVRCWKCLDEERQRTVCRRMKQVADWISRYRPPYLHPITLSEEGIRTIKGVSPVVRMKWYDDPNLKEYISLHLGTPSLLRQLSGSFVAMVSCLHRLHLAHGDINMDNIRVRPDGSLYLIDYDTFFVPTMQREEDDLKGQAEYQHPARNSNRYLSEYMDYFSEYVIFLTLRSLSAYPELWELFGLAGQSSHLLSRDELSDIRRSRLYAFMREKNDPSLLALLHCMDDMWQHATRLDAIVPIECIKTAISLF